MVGDIFSEVSILGWGALLIFLSNLVFFRFILPAFRIDAPRILQDMFFALVCIAWGFTRLRHAGVDLSGLITTSAVITGIIAFSMQETLGNILGGLALQLDNSVRIGDWIKVEDVRGKVINVHWRHTSILTNNGEKIVIPNSTLMKSKVDVFGSTDCPLTRRNIRFCTGYSASPSLVIAAVEKAICDAKIDHVAKIPAPQCIVTDYLDGSIHFALRYWLSNQLLDEGTDSNIRLHIFTCLQRQDFLLARPCLDVSLMTESDERNNRTEQLDLKIEQRMKMLSTVKLFASLQKNELLQIAKTLRDVSFTIDDAMTRQGDVDHWLYVIVSGKADVWYELNKHDRSYLATLKSGDVFGEMGLMTGEPRSATVSAQTNTECYRIDKASFETILHARPELANDFAQLIDERHLGLTAAKQEENSSIQSRQATILGNIKQFFRLPKKDNTQS
jgi:small-conductance mechanosensitive channel